MCRYTSACWEVLGASSVRSSSVMIRRLQSHESENQSCQLTILRDYAGGKYVKGWVENEYVLYVLNMCRIVGVFLSPIRVVKVGRIEWGWASLADLGENKQPIRVKDKDYFILTIGCRLSLLPLLTHALSLSYYTVDVCRLYSMMGWFSWVDLVWIRFRFDSLLPYVHTVQYPNSHPTRPKTNRTIQRT